MERREKQTMSPSYWKPAAWVLAGSLLLVSCGPKTPTLSGPLPLASASTQMQWPDPPEPGRIRFLGTLSGPSDLGITKSFWGRIREFFAGRSPEQRILRPYGVTTDAQGNLYVADTGTRAIHVFNVGEQNYRIIEDGEDLKSPTDIATGPADQIFVSDTERGLILEFSSQGKLIGEIGRDTLVRPVGVVFNSVSDLLYVVDVAQHQVFSYDLDGNLQQRLGRRGTDDGEFNFPTNIATDKRGFLYVTDSLNFRIQTFDAQGNFVGRFGQAGDSVGNFAKPKGIAVDSEGHIYVVEGLFDTILIYDSQGQLLLSFGSPGKDPGEFWLATGIHIDSADRIYVSDSYNSRIQVFQYLAQDKEPEIR